VITKETISRIIRFNEGDLPVVSLYVGVGQDGPTALSTQVNSLLHEIRPLGQDPALDRRARLSIREDVRRIENLEGLERVETGAVAVFSCSEGDMFEQLVLPRAVRDRVVVDATPWVRPMLAVLDEYHRSCVLVIDKRSAEAWELYQDEIREVGKVQDPTLRKPNYAGWYGLAEHRVRNRADDLTKRHFRNSVRLLDELFRTGDYELLIIGGHPEEVPTFVEFLPHHLRPKVTGSFTVDPRTATPADIRHHAARIVEQYERCEERRRVADVMESMATRRPAALGLPDCLWAGSVAAVGTLLVQEGATAPGVVCDESGWLAMSGDMCPLCGRATRWTPDVIDELTEAVIDEGGLVEHVVADTDLRDHVVAASLRFPLPPRVETPA
jgi:peptide chain release factor subunit 1